MKLQFFSLVFALTTFSCGDSNKELYQITDDFVESLYTKYESYGTNTGKFTPGTMDDPQYMMQLAFTRLRQRYPSMTDDFDKFKEGMLYDQAARDWAYRQLSKGYGAEDLTQERFNKTILNYEELGEYHTKFTSDGEYKVMPTGRLINVSIERAADSKEYEELVEDLKEHYEGNSRVNDVFINKLGTIMIDCRN